MQSKIQLDYKEKNNNLISEYRYQPVQCEICKEYMPDFIKKNSHLYEICDYHSNSEKGNQNYFTLETIGSLKNHEKFIFHIIIKPKNPISIINIGRSEECDIKLSDNTISRFHSVITVFGRSLLTFYQYLKNNSFCKCFNKRKNIVNTEVSDEEFYINENKKCINFESGYTIKINN